MKKSLVIMLTLVLVLAAFTACKKAPNKTDELSQGEKIEGQTKDVSVTEAETTEIRQVTLNVMMSFPRFTDQMETFLDKFKAKQLEEKNIDVTINLEMPSSDQYNNTLQTRLSSNDAPDLFTLHASADLPTYVEAGYVADLSDQSFVKTLYPDVKTAVSIDDKVFAVPFESTAWGYLYNKDIFDDLNLTVPDTLEEMKEIVKILKDNGYTPFELAFQEAWVPQLMTALTLGGLTSGENPDWLERMYKDEASYSEVAEIFGIIDLIMENGTKRAFETGSEQGAANFANGEAVMFVQGPWIAESILSVNEDMRVGVGALPINDNIDCTKVNLATTTSLAVYSGSKEMEVALDLANFILDEEFSSELYSDLMFNPVSTVHDFQQFSWAEDASSYVEAGRAYLDLKIPNAVTDEQGKLLQSYYAGQTTKEEFIEILDQTFKSANQVIDK